MWHDDDLDFDIFGTIDDGEGYDGRGTDIDLDDVVDFALSDDFATLCGIDSDGNRCEHPVTIDVRLFAAGEWMTVKFFASVLIAQCTIDLREHRLPRSITYAGIILGAVMLAAAAVVISEPERIWMAALGAAVAYAFIGVIHLLSNGQGQWARHRRCDPGTALLGLYLGWLNPRIVIPGLIFGFVIGAIVAVPALLTIRAKAETQLPFGPFMALGAVAAVFVATLS